MRLIGALLNHDERLARLADLSKKLLARESRSQQPASERLRSGTVQQAVVAVLEDSAQPMHAVAVHAAVERLLGVSISRDTINSCLSVGARGSDSQFERLGRGRYRLHSSSEA